MRVDSLLLLRVVLRCGMGRGRLRARNLTRSVGEALVRVQQLLVLWLLLQLQLLLHQLEVLRWDLRLGDAVQRARRGRH